MKNTTMIFFFPNGLRLERMTLLPYWPPCGALREMNVFTL